MPRITELITTKKLITRKKLSCLTFISLLLLVLVLLFFSSCKKINDKKSEDTPFISEKPEDVFLKLPENSSPQLTHLVAEIKKNNDKYHFLNQLIKSNGLPVWSKVIANVPIITISAPVRVNGKIADAGNEELFFIPLRASDSSIKTYIACIKDSGGYKFDIYRREYLTRLYFGNDTLKEFRRNMMALFSFFEKSINHKDSIYVEGKYQTSISDVTLNITGSSFSNKIFQNSRIPGSSAIQICYTISYDENPTMRTSTYISQTCETIYLWGETLGTSVIGGGGTGSGSSGTSGGGSGGTSDYTNYNCPAEEWWCESGEYRIKDGILFTTDNYPYKEEGWEWLWWEKSIPSQDKLKFDNIDAQNNEADKIPQGLLNCKGTNRTGNIQWPGTMEHWIIMIDYISMLQPFYGEVEYAIPGSSATGARGYADMVNKYTGDIFEIKPPSAQADGVIEVERYVNRANEYCKSSLLNPSINPTWRKGNYYSTRNLPNPKDPSKVLRAELGTNE